MVRPFFPLVIALILGIISSYYFQFTVAFTIMLLVLFMCIFIYNTIYEKNIQYILIFVLFTIGILISLSNNSGLETYLNKRIECLGTVDQILYTSSSNGKYVIKVYNINKSDIDQEKIMLNVISRKDLKLGDKISFYGVLKEPMPNTNPKLFNYKLSLMSEKIFTTMTINDYQIRSVNSERSLKYKLKDKFTNNVEDLFHTYLNKDNSQLITSIILGESSYIDEDNLFLYRELGLAHILAVSGLHIGIITGFLIFIFSRLGIKRRINICLSLSIIWIYGFLIGYPPSILRASIMFSLLFYSSIIHEPYDSINTLSIACFILLLVNPYYLFNMGFQLSFVAAFSIVYLTPYIKRIFYPYNGKISNTIASLFAVNIGLLPIQAYYFNRIGLLTILANLILVPIFSFSLILGLIMVVCFYTLPFLNIIIGPILNIVLLLQYFILKIIPSVTLKIFSPGPIAIILYFLLVMMIFNIINIKKLEKKIKTSILIYLIFLIIVNSISIYGDKSIELHFIDVGQGDSILIRTKNGNYLMDTGGSPMENGFDISKYITLPYLEKLGINRLKAIFISHFHADHSQGVPLLVENLKVDNIVGSYIPKDYEFPVIVLKQYDEIMLDENTKLTVIWPGNTNSNNENNMSLVALLTYFNKSVLFTGDIEKEIEPLVADMLDKNIDILKVPHHGSSTSSTDYFLNKLNSSIAIFSVGRNNLYNHPSREVVSRYENINSEIYRTDENGLVKIIFKGDNYDIKPYLQVGKINLIEFTRKNILNICFYLLYCSLSYMLIKIYISIKKELEIIEL